MNTMEYEIHDKSWHLEKIQILINPEKPTKLFPAECGYTPEDTALRGR